MAKGALTNISASINVKGAGWPSSGWHMGVTNINGTNASGKTISGATPLPGSFHNPP